MSFTDSYPVITAATVVAIVAALLSFGAAFGLTITDQQREAILGLVAVLAPFAVWLLVRPNVTPNAVVKLYYRAVSGGPSPH